MKIRTDFVTNSSSSSFICVGIDNEDIIKQLLIAEGYDENKDESINDWNESDRDGIIDFIIDDYSYIICAGFEGSTQLKDKTVNQVKQELIKKVKDKYSIEIPEKYIDLYYGEYSC